MNNKAELNLSKIYQRTHLLIHIFYGVFFFCVFTKLMALPGLYGKIKPPYPAEILSWVPIDYWYQFSYLLSFFSIMALLACTLYPWSRVLRILVTVLLTLANGIDSSYGSYNHAIYGWIMASGALIFLPKLEYPFEQYMISKTMKLKVIRIFFIAQFSSLICYGLAGIWKVKLFFPRYKYDGFEGVIGALSNVIAFEHIKYGHEISNISLFFVEHVYIAGFMYFGLVALQFLSPLLLFFTRYHILFGSFLIFFHISGEIIVHIPFRDQMYLVLIFFIFSPFNLQRSKH